MDLAVSWDSDMCYLHKKLLFYRPIFFCYIVVLETQDSILDQYLVKCAWQLHHYTVSSTNKTAHRVAIICEKAIFHNYCLLFITSHRSKKYDHWLCEEFQPECYLCTYICEKNVILLLWDKKKTRDKMLDSTEAASLYINCSMYWFSTTRWHLEPIYIVNILSPMEYWLICQT